MRKRNFGTGRHFKHLVKDRFLMLLVYYKIYITNALTGFLFDLDQSNACRDILYMEPIVKSCIPLPSRMYNMVRRLQTVAKVELYFPGFKVFVDCTKQEIPIPKDQKEKSTILVKRKKRTVKTHLMVNRNGEILYKSNNHKEGRQHDYTVYKEEHPQTPQDIKKYFDLNYVGITRDLPYSNTVLSIKKKRNNSKLAKGEKLYNKRHHR